jgi:outer membrane protein assembly factor BamB
MRFVCSSPRSVLAALVVSVLPSGLLNAADEWTRFLGPQQNNVLPAETKIPLVWDEKKGVAWRTEIPGEGWSSPLVQDGRVWMTTATEGGLSLRAVAVELASGRILKDVEVFRLEAVPAKHRRNSFASPTGLLSGGRFFVHFGTHGTAALDAKTGEVLWCQQGLKVDHQNGAGGSLTEFGDLLLVPCDGMDVQHEVALKKSTGEIAWKSERSAKPFLDTLPADMRKAYGTPFLLGSGAQAVSLTTASTRLYALDPATGAERWHVNYGKGFSNVPLPATDGKTLVICTGFMKPEVWGVKLEGAKGDVSESHVLWRQKSAAPDQTTPVIANGLVFMVSSGGIASCLDLATGEMRWRERIGSDFAATPLVSGGLVYFWDCLGATTVVKAAAEFEVVGKNTLPEGFMASPAVVGNTLVLRTKTALYRVE